MSQRLRAAIVLLSHVVVGEHGCAITRGTLLLGIGAVYAAVHKTGVGWALPALCQLFFLLFISLLHSVSKLVEKLAAGFLLLHYHIDVLVHCHHALDITRHLFSFGVGSILEDGLLRSRVANPDSLFDIVLPGYHLAVGNQLI